MVPPMSLHTPESPAERLLETTRQTYDQLDTEHRLNGTIRESDRTSSLTYVWDDNDRTQYIQTNVREDGGAHEVEVEWHIRKDNPNDDGYTWDNFVVDTVSPNPDNVRRAIQQAYDEVRNTARDDLSYTKSGVSSDI